MTNTKKAVIAQMVMAAVAQLSYSTLASAQEPTVLRDPHLRDEDISGASVVSSVRRLTGGLYEYRYDVINPPTSLGKLFLFDLDMTCGLDFGAVSFPEPPHDYSREDDSDGKHVPLQAYPGVRSETGKAGGGAGITVFNSLLWSPNLSAGHDVRGLRVLSPAPPGPREYRLSVSMFIDDIEADGSGWNYAAFRGDPTVPWLDDFEVRGITTGPSCALPGPGEPPPPPTTRFAGSNPSDYNSSVGESDAVNALLTYSAPLTDRFHVASTVSSVKVTIHYSSDIDPKTFKVEPAWARNLFSPEAGKTETIQVPLRDPKSLFKLEVHALQNKTPRKENELDQSYKDRDVFEIRRDPEPPKTPPGRK